MAPLNTVLVSFRQRSKTIFSVSKVRSLLPPVNMISLSSTITVAAIELTRSRNLAWIRKRQGFPRCCVYSCGPFPENDHATQHFSLCQARNFRSPTFPGNAQARPAPSILSRGQSLSCSDSERELHPDGDLSDRE